MTKSLILRTNSCSVCRCDCSPPLNVKCFLIVLIELVYVEEPFCRFILQTFHSVLIGVSCSFYVSCIRRRASTAYLLIIHDSTLFKRSAISCSLFFTCYFRCHGVLFRRIKTLIYSMHVSMRIPINRYYDN